MNSGFAPAPPVQMMAALQAMVIKAINKAFTVHQSTKDKVIECVDETLNEELTDQAAALEEQIRTLQLQLMGYRSDAPEVERIGSEIIQLRNQKDELLSQTALSAQRTNEIRELASFFDGLDGPVETYDESYVRRLLSNIKVHEDRLIFTFKDGKEITMHVEAGQKVIYSKYAGTEVKVDGEELIIVRQSDILAIVE